MKFLTRSFSILLLLSSTTLVPNYILAQTPRNELPRLSTPQPKPTNPLEIKNPTTEDKQGKTATCKGSLRDCQKFISACEAGYGGVTAGDADKLNIPQKWTCTLP
jgi:hypothetical protein